MPDRDRTDPPATDLAREVAGLRREIETLNAQRFFVINGSIVRMVWAQFLRGLAMGLGTVLGATALVSLIGFSLREIDFIPVIGDWAAQIAREIQSSTE